MLAPPIGLMRTGLALKLSQVKLATRSYFRDRTNQATGTLSSYAIAAGLFAAAAIFAVAACLVGIIALFRWIEIKYGMFPAFGAVGAALLVIAALCASLAAARLNRPPKHFPSLTSRLRVAIRANPVQPDQIAAVRDTAAAILLAPAAPSARTGGRRFRESSKATFKATSKPTSRGNGRMRTGLILMATLLGWAATRRRQQARRTAA